MSDNELKDFLKKIIAKAWDDSDFKDELISDPIYAIKKFTGAVVVLPEGKELIVTDQTDSNKVFLNIPTKPSLENGTKFQ